MLSNLFFSNVFRSVAICLLYAMEFKNMSLLDAYNHLKEIRSSQLQDVCTNVSFQRVCTENELVMGRTDINTIATWPGSRNSTGFVRARACKSKVEQKRSTKPFVSTAPVSTKGATPQGAVKLILFYNQSLKMFM